MKAILEFNLPDEHCEHVIAVHAMDWALSVKALNEVLRDWDKFGRHGFKTANEAIKKIRNELQGILCNKNISLDMIDEAKP